MRRTHECIGTYLLLGLIATIGMAWGSALFCRPAPTHLVAEQVAPHRMVWLHSSWGGTRAQVWGVVGLDGAAVYAPTHGGRIPASVEMPRRVFRQVGKSAVRGFVAAEARGLPWRALRWFEYADVATQSAVESDGKFAVQQVMTPETRGALVVGDGSITTDGIGLPYIPFWPGLIGDTLVFAAVFGTLHQFAAAARRSRRRGRTQWPTCAYDLTGITGPYPECGHNP